MRNPRLVRSAFEEEERKWEKTEWNIRDNLLGNWENTGKAQK